MPEYTGKNVNYYLVEIPSPKRLPPYTAEAEDIIEALGMSFAEGCAFKAIWRNCAARISGLMKQGYIDGVYDAEKVEYYGSRMLATELRKRKVAETPRAPVANYPSPAPQVPAPFQPAPQMQPPPPPPQPAPQRPGMQPLPHASDANE